MKTADGIAWFKETFGERIEAGLAGTPFSLELVAAIAQQETGYMWGAFVEKGMAESEILRLCVGDTLDAERGRSCFPRTKKELCAAPRGQEMFAIARGALLAMASHVRGYEAATINPNKFCHGFGIFQYDLQFFRENPAYFLEQAWGNFDACLAQFVKELRQAAARQGWAGKKHLTEEEKIFVAIAYNKGTADCRLGFKQGHKCDGRCYGENIQEFLHVAKGIGGRAVATPLRRSAGAVLRLPSILPAGWRRTGAIFEVVVEEKPLRLRSEPKVSEPNPGANVIARLPRGHLVQRVAPRPVGEFLEVESEWEGARLRGFASMKFLRLVKRATRVSGGSRRAVTAAQAGVRRSRKLTPAEAEKQIPSNPQQPKGTKVAPTPPEQARDLMPTMNIEEIIRAVQKEVGVGVDGKAGPQTWQAIYFRLKGSQPAASAPASAAAATTTPKLPASMRGKVDPRSEKVIATLEPEVHNYARALVQKAAAIGITIKLISGLRTYAEQNALYEIGRSKPGRIVTNARGGFSNHNFAIAFDIGVFRGSSYVPEGPQYKAVGALGMQLGLDWGGNWKTMKDEPHFQLRPAWAAGMPEREMLAELRARKARGQGPFA